MILKVENNRLCLQIEDSDPKFKIINREAKGESTILYHVKNELNRLVGKDIFIKKRMWKDGHLVDDTQQYVRSKDSKIMLWNDSWQIRGIDTDIVKYGKAHLTIVCGGELLESIVN